MKISLDLNLIFNNLDYAKNIGKFIDLLLFENEKYNLTSITKKEDIYYKHILDSLSGYFIIKDIFNDEIYDKNIADIGCGAGFPSLPMLLYDNKLKFFLIESSKKKVLFLEKIRDEFKLNFAIINKNYKEINEYNFDIIIFRALDDIVNVLKGSKKLFNKKTYVFAYKGKLEQINKEIETLKNNKNIYNFIKKIEIHNIYGIKDEDRNIVEILWEK